MLQISCLASLLLVKAVSCYQLSESLASQPFLMPSGAQYRYLLRLLFTFTFFFCSWKPSVFQGPVDATGSQSCWRFCKKVIVKCFKRFDNIIKCFLSGSSTVCNFLRISLLSGRIERKLIKPYFPRQTINLPLIGLWYFIVCSFRSEDNVTGKK